MWQAESMGQNPHVNIFANMKLICAVFLLVTV